MNRRGFIQTLVSAASGWCLAKTPLAGYFLATPDPVPKGAGLWLTDAGVVFYTSSGEYEDISDILLKGAGKKIARMECEALYG